MPANSRWDLIRRLRVKIYFIHGVVLFHVCLYATTVPVSEPGVEIFLFIVNTGNLEYKTSYVIKYIFSTTYM